MEIKLNDADMEKLADLTAKRLDRNGLAVGAGGEQCSKHKQWISCCAVPGAKVTFSKPDSYMELGPNGLTTMGASIFIPAPAAYPADLALTHNLDWSQK